MKESEIRRAATVGTFDGIHRGHRAVLETLTHEATLRGLVPTVLTFSEHPLTLIAPERAPKLLMPTDEKMALLSEEGVEAHLLDFTTEMMAMTAKEWMRNLRDNHSVELIVVGYDNTFGSDGRSMRPEDYIKLGQELGIEMIEAPVIAGCSSSSARHAVADGNMEEAMRILGHPFSLSGIVEHGDRIGRTLGFPTANLALPQPGNQLLPPFGVYATIAVLSDGRKLPAVTNIGVRPSVSLTPMLRIETHILDFDEDIYDQPLTINLIRRIRPERRFNSLDSLKKAIETDKNQATALLTNYLQNT